MGHGEDREQAGSVDKVQMSAQERSHLVKFRPEYPCFGKTNDQKCPRSSASRPAHRASWGVGGARSLAAFGRSEVVTRYNLRSDTTSDLSDPLQSVNRANANFYTHPRTSHGLHGCIQNRLPPCLRCNRAHKRASRTPSRKVFDGRTHYDFTLRSRFPRKTRWLHRN